jgi:lipopolysaccharide/colanic/teichoic acid biosynthesis glycosyltransferase
MHLNADQVLERLRHQSDADGVAFKMKRDPRVTSVGRVLRKYSIDELPQLFSILMGHMSIVGPRPHLPSEVACYRPDQRLRLTVKPGLLCYREIRGRSDLTFEEWVRLDLEYIRERSAWTDTKIFFLAFPAVLGARGAY